jgi:hypothetical protein
MARRAARVFSVESIVGHRRRGGRLEYRVRWEGYGADKDTWEPARNLLADGVGHIIRKHYMMEALIAQLLINIE